MVTKLDEILTHVVLTLLRYDITAFLDVFIMVISISRLEPIEVSKNCFPTWTLGSCVFVVILGCNVLAWL